MCFQGGVQGQNAKVDEDITILIDFKKYQQLHQVKVANSSKSEVCTALENGIYQKCASKCVSSCRFQIPSISDIAMTSIDCAKSECIEGCFCKIGFVRYQDKCILSKNCPTRANKSMEFVTKMPNTLEKRIIKPGCGSNTGCILPPKPCIPFLCNNQNSGKNNKNSFQFIRSLVY